MLLQEVELKLVFVSDKIQLEQPFQAVLKLQSNVDRQLGPLTLAVAPGMSLPIFANETRRCCMLLALHQALSFRKVCGAHCSMFLVKKERELWY